MKTKTVLHYKDGRVVKGFTDSFFVNQGFFKFIPVDEEREIEIDAADLKAVFFVKDFEGSRDYREDRNFISMEERFGEKTVVIFQDGEEIWGYSLLFNPSRKGFYLFPSDSKSNNSKVYVVCSSTAEVKIC